MNRELHPILCIVWNSHRWSAVIRYLAKLLFLILIYLIPNIPISARKEARRAIHIAMAIPTLFIKWRMCTKVILGSSATTEQESVCECLTALSCPSTSRDHTMEIINVFMFAYQLLYAIQDTTWHQDKGSPTLGVSTSLC